MGNDWKIWAVLPLGLMAGPVAAGPLTLAEDSRTNYTIVTAPGATVAEQHAAKELATFLKRVTGATFPIKLVSEAGEGPRLLVGPGEPVRAVAPDLKLEKLGRDGFVLETRGPHLILAGDRPRGTLYAVYTFLEDVVGCRWWSSRVSTIPRKPTLTVPELHDRQEPILEYREPYYWDAFDPDWAVRNKTNGTRPRLDEARGGRITYKGFVHTFNALVPPDQYFAEHPDWFSEIKGKRRSERAQLCLTNPQVIDFVTKRVKEWLRESPDASIVSVSQNDWRGWCECPACRRVDEEEGSHAGTMIRFVNAVAAGVELEFPNVAISTLAYQYTRKPPALVRPRPNVIVRLCSVECSFAHPLESEMNRSFRDDLVAWSRICDRLYVWDYVTNFGIYIQPHPNLRVLGPNVRLLVNHGVKGLFEQGNYHSRGGEFAELRAWVLAKLMWNPERDADALIDEFLKGYYGAAAPRIRAYIDLIHDAVEETDHYLNIHSTATAPFLTLDVLSQAARHFDGAEAAVADQPDVLMRVRIARLPVRYVWAMRWHELRQEAEARGMEWARPADCEQAARDFLAVARDNGIKKLGERRSIQVFAQRTIGVGRRTAPPPPGCEELPRDQWMDLQDESIGIAMEGRWGALTPDPAASDYVAVRMPGDHQHWAVQKALALRGIGREPKATYRCYAVIKCEATGTEGLAFSYGLYDVANRKDVGGGRVEAKDVADADYHVYEVATAALHARMYLWVAPPGNPENVQAVWVDRFFLVREE